MHAVPALEGANVTSMDTTMEILPMRHATHMYYGEVHKTFLPLHADVAEYGSELIKDV